MCFTIPVTSLLIINLVLPTHTEAGVPLQLIPFKESSHAVRLVPNTLELNEIIDRTLDSIRRLSEMENYYFSINGVYKHFSYQMSNGSVNGVFQTSNGSLWNLTDLVRMGNAYIYNNEEDSIQVVTQLLLNPLQLNYEQYNVTVGQSKDIGSVDGIMDSSQVDVRITFRVRQNNSLPLIFVCDGKVDELSFTAGKLHFTVVELSGYREFDSVVVDGLTDHFNNNVIDHLQKLLTSSFDSSVRRDEQLCYSLVLCNSCDFYAADT